MNSKDFAKVAREYFAEREEGRDLVAVTAVFKDGGGLRIELGPETFEDAHEGLKDRELLFLKLLPAPDKPGIDYAEIKKITGYKNIAHVRRIVKSLARRGFAVKDGTGFRRAKI